MEVDQGTVQGILTSLRPLTLFWAFLAFLFLRLLLRYILRILPFNSLASIPGPLTARLSSLFLTYHAYIGDEASVVHDLHEQYGPVVRTGPNSVDISDGDALQAIYVDKGGFLKPDFYSNFDIDGHQSIFSALIPAHRAPRAKAVFGIFSTASLRAGTDAINAAVDGFVARMRREYVLVKKQRVPSDESIDILGLCRALAIDIVTGYLFNLKYGACEEDLHDIKEEQKKLVNRTADEESMSASAMVDSFVAVGKVWYLSPWIFELSQWVTNKFYPDKLGVQSIQLVDAFVARAVAKTIEDKNHTSYPGRLLQAGFSESEVRAQCKDLIFAGTDSTAMNLATICFHLIKNPQIHQKLRDEIGSTSYQDNELQSLPYLRGVVREGLRLSMANPSRLPRLVPKEGWRFKSTYIPSGTVVSCTPFELHLNPTVFADPYSFKPERWLPENKPTEEMHRDHIPFGLGSRQCIARNLATTELFCAVSRIAQENLLAGTTCVRDRIDILEWFNSHVVGGKIEIKVN